MDGSCSDGSDTNRKTRRSHKKSRNGCEKCKVRRIKCDELKPKCSRCSKLGLACRYPTRNRISAPGEEYEQIEPPLQLQRSQRTFLAALTRPQLFNLLTYDETVVPIWQPHPVQMLAPAESVLLEHYLEHTSKDLTVDDGDQYALQVGIPNLAFQSKPLMRSVLAFSAICKCHDLIKQSPVSHVARGEILSLLHTADRYHMESLREIQPTLSKVKHYDHILANAAMMGMYGSGSHCVRIWLTETATSTNLASDDFMPKSGQWISLFRAVRVAYGGLVRQGSGAQDNLHDVPVFPADNTSTCRGELQRGLHDHPLYPIIAATIPSAIIKLGKQVDKMQVIGLRIREMTSPNNDRPDTDAAADLEACLTALGLLREIVDETFTPKEPTSCAPSHLNQCLEADLDPKNQGAMISPWMRRYTASITSMVPSKLPRRFIMAFVHKAPTRFLKLVEQMMGFIRDETETNACLDSQEIHHQKPDLAHHLAMEIFAHWLVMVLLLDNVWWIGGIGSWELRHIVIAKRDAPWSGKLWDNSGDWWPESMLEISRQLSKYRGKS